MQNEFTYYVTDSPCTGSFLSRSILMQSALDVNINNVRIRDNQQRLFTDITFTCNGSITKWIVGGTAVSGASLPELQIWRNTGATSYIKASFSILPSSAAPDSNNIVEYIPTLHWSSRRETYWECTNPRQKDSALVVYYQDRDGPVNYLEGNNPLSALNLGTSSNEY